MKYVTFIRDEAGEFSHVEHPTRRQAIDYVLAEMESDRNAGLEPQEYHIREVEE